MFMGVLTKQPILFFYFSLKPIETFFNTKLIVVAKYFLELINHQTSRYH